MQRCTLGAGWLVSPRDALALSSMVAFGIGLAGLLMAIRSGRRGDRLAWIAVFGVLFMLIAIAGLSWIALDRRGVPWLVHPASALAGMAYLTLRRSHAVAAVFIPDRAARSPGARPSLRSA